MRGKRCAKPALVDEISDSDAAEAYCFARSAQATLAECETLLVVHSERLRLRLETAAFHALRHSAVHALGDRCQANAAAPAVPSGDNPRCVAHSYLHRERYSAKRASDGARNQPLSAR